METVIVVLISGAAFVATIRYIRRTFKKGEFCHNCDTGKGGCGGKEKQRTDDRRQTTDDRKGN